MSVICGQAKNGMARSRLVFVTLFGLFLSSQAAAEKWYFEPNVSGRIGYNDNAQLSRDSEISTYTSHIVANAAAGFRTNVSDVSINAKMVDRRFDDHANLNTNDQFLKLDSSFRSGLNLFGLGADYERENTRTSEFDFSGYSRTDKIRITKSISPYWDRTLTERASIRVGGSYQDVAYEDAELTGLNDYIYRSAYTSLQYRLTERTTLQTVLSKSLYTSDSTEFDSTSIQLGVSHLLSETLSFNLLLGPNYTKSEFISGGIEQETSDVGRLIDIGLRKEFELTSLSGSLSTSESAGGEGKMTSRTNLSFYLNHKLSERTTFKLSSAWQKNESGGGRTDPSIDRTYRYFEPSLSWKATPWWTISGSYRYQESENTSTDAGPAKSNAVYLTVKYVWPKESLSRWMDL
jgi:hypothetical protein